MTDEDQTTQPVDQPVGDDQGDAGNGGGEDQGDAQDADKGE